MGISDAIFLRYIPQYIVPPTISEREVKMPYHQPKKLGLSVFLARTQQKQEALKKITPG